MTEPAPPIPGIVRLMAVAGGLGAANLHYSQPLLPSIAAVVVGGTAITGGYGGLVRTLVGVLTVTVMRVGIAVTGIDPAYEPIAYGMMVVVAVAITVDRAKISIVK